LEIAVATELTSGAISNILEAVPGIANVLRSPVADAIINLSRAAAGLAPFDKKDAHELVRYAVRRGLIRSDEGDRVEQEIDSGVIIPPKPPAPPPVAPARPFHRPPAAAKASAPATPVKTRAAHPVVKKRPVAKKAKKAKAKSRRPNRTAKKPKSKKK
jgi:hypothetical protein